MWCDSVRISRLADGDARISRTPKDLLDPRLHAHMTMVSRTKEDPGREPLRLRAADAARWYVRRVLSSKREQTDAVSCQDRRQVSFPSESAQPTCKASSATSSIADTGRKFVSGLPLSSGMSNEQSLGGIAPKGRGGLQTIIRAPMLPRHMRRAEPSLKRVFL